MSTTAHSTPPAPVRVILHLTANMPLLLLWVIRRILLVVMQALPLLPRHPTPTSPLLGTTLTVSRAR
jgi:hypothetical protein